MLPLAQALVESGHEVAFATAADYCPSIEKLGFATFPAGMSLAQQLEEAAGKYPEQAHQPLGKRRFETFVPRMLAGVAAPSRAQELVTIMGDWRADVLVHDETEFGGPVAATRLGIPYADQSVGILRPLGMARLTGAVLAPLAEQLGTAVGPFGGLFRYLYLDVCPPRLQSPEIETIAVAHQVHNLSAARPGQDGLPQWFASMPDRPLVYVSLGTVFNRDQKVFQAILQGLAGEALNIVLTIGTNNDPADLGPQPDHIHVERFIPQALILPHCSAVINQGGTAILDILGHGLPLLVLPQSANQFHNAEACVAAGAARALLPEEVSPASVCLEMTALLDEPEYRENAQSIQREFAAMPGPPAGVRLVEQLAQQRQPLLRSAFTGEPRA
jgi:UDP:flavonoid glycosyltransferase YjiC (YdhE family)